MWSFHVLEESHEYFKQPDTIQTLFLDGDEDIMFPTDRFQISMNVPAVPVTEASASILSAAIVANARQAID